MVAALFGWGAWERRWIADDGLIVLRTVRNLLAGNGPVFNTGERVEANTSTIWTYLIYLGGWIGGPVRLEYVALVLALVLSVAGVAHGDARRRPAVRAEPAGPAGAAATRRGACLHRGAARARLRHLGTRKRFGSGLFGPAVVDDGLLVAGAARLSRPAAPADAAQGRTADATQSTPPRCTAAADHQRRQPILRCGTGFRRRVECAGASRAGAGRRARADHDARRGPWLAPARADRRRGRPGAGRLRDLPDGLLRPALPGHRARQGCVGIQMGPRLCVSGQLQPARICCGRPRSCSSALASSRW